MSSNLSFSAEEIRNYYAARVPKLKQQQGGEWRGQCPIHNGHGDNFTVDPETGRWFCHSTCGRGGDMLSLEEALFGGNFTTRKAEVFRLVGRIEADQRDYGSRNGHTQATGSSRSRTAAGPWREVERYRYVDANQQLLYEVVRFLKPDGDKTFVQVRPSGVEAAGTTDPGCIDGIPTGGLVVGLDAGAYVRDADAERSSGKLTWKRAKQENSKLNNGKCQFRECPRVPYRLTKILGSDTVFLTEGEKDVHTIEAWGLVASCNSGGSGSSEYFARWLEYFQNRHIVVLPDNDGAGRKHAAAVAQILLGVAASVRVVELPGLSEKGDITDWQSAGGTHNQFPELTTKAPCLDAVALAALQSRWESADREAGQKRPHSSAVVDWPAPAPLQNVLPPVEAFSENLLPTAFRKLVVDIADRMQVAIDCPAAAVIVGLAGVVNRRAIIQPKEHDTGWRVIPNLWGGIVTPPGFMKSPVIQTATRPIETIQAGWRHKNEADLVRYRLAKEEFDIRLSAWKEQCKAAMKKQSTLPSRPQEEPIEPILRRLVVNDATFEAMHKAMNENPAGIFVIRDELPGWWSQLDRAGREGERAFCLQAWNGDTSFTLDRIGRGVIHVAACCMSMLGGIQPGRLRSYMADAIEDGPNNDGLIQRFQVLVWPDMPSNWAYVDRMANSTAEHQVADIFGRLVQLDSENPARFRFEGDAQELFVEWLTGLEGKVRGDELHPALVSHLAKYRSLMPSLALLFELAERASSEGFDGSILAGTQNFVALESAKRAAAWCDYLESHANRVYSCVTTPQLRAAKELAEKIKKKKVGSEGVFSCRDVYLKGWAGLDNPESVKSAAEVLEDAGWVREQRNAAGPTGGRPSNRYEVNPAVWERTTSGEDVSQVL